MFFNQIMSIFYCVIVRYLRCGTLHLWCIPGSIHIDKYWTASHHSHPNWLLFCMCAGVLCVSGGEKRRETIPRKETSRPCSFRGKYISTYVHLYMRTCHLLISFKLFSPDVVFIPPQREYLVRFLSFDLLYTSKCSCAKFKYFYVRTLHGHMVLQK